MRKHLLKDNRGSSPLIIVLIVVVLVAIAGAGYYVYNKQKTKSSVSNSSGPTAQEIQAACKSEDKNICKFISSWKNVKYYTISSSSTTGGKTSTMQIAYVAPDSYHFTMTGETAMETITIGNTTYTKDTSDGKWWKQTLSQQDTDKSTSAAKEDFKEPDSSQPAAQQTTYKSLGTEACGNLTCYKYQVIDPAEKSTTNYIWFDTKDFQLRKTQTVTADGTDTATFSYDKVSISAPSPTKDLPAGQPPVSVPSLDSSEQ